MVRLTDRSDMTLDVYRGRKTTIQQELIVRIMSCLLLAKARCKYYCSGGNVSRIRVFCFSSVILTIYRQVRHSDPGLVLSTS